jgi:hypothetical protein
LDRVATLCRITEVERQQVGARVELVGEGRLQLCDIVAVEPYVKGVFRQVRTMADTTVYVPTEAEVVRVELLVSELRAMLKDVLLLSDKLGARGGGGGGDNEDDVAAETSDDVAGFNEWGHMEISSLEKSLEWVDGPSVKLEALGSEPTTMAEVTWAAEDRRSAMEVAERLSFAILQVAPASSVSDVRRLLEARTGVCVAHNSKTAASCVGLLGFYPMFLRVENGCFPRTITTQKRIEPRFRCVLTWAGCATACVRVPQRRWRWRRGSPRASTPHTRCWMSSSSSCEPRWRSSHWESERVHA